MNETLSCPMCRANVRWIYDYHLDRDKYVDKSTNSVLYHGLKQLVNNGFELKKFYKIYTEFIKNGIIPFLLPEQAEELISLLPKNDNHNNYQKVIVALCFAPWHVNREIANVGVCYSGNFAEEPECLIAQISYMRQNIYKLVLRQAHL